MIPPPKSTLTEQVPEQLSEPPTTAASLGGNWSYTCTYILYEYLVLVLVTFTSIPSAQTSPASDHLTDQPPSCGKYQGFPLTGSASPYIRFKYIYANHTVSSHLPLGYVMLGFHICLCV